MEEKKMSDGWYDRWVISNDGGNARLETYKEEQLVVEVNNEEQKTIITADEILSWKQCLPFLALRRK